MNKSISHCITPTENATWIHTCNENLLLALIPGDDKSGEVETTLFAAFEQALILFAKINNTLNISEINPFVGGLYLVNNTNMASAMSTIDGMAQTSVNNTTKTYDGTPSEVNIQFFQDVLSLDEELKYLKYYLLNYMKIIQGTAKQTIATTIGILTCVVGYNSLTQETATTFTYVTATTTTKEKFEELNCESSDLDEYTYEFDIVKFNYSPN